jgi:Ras-related protein Rab-8A
MLFVLWQVYSVADRKTFNNITSWMSQISQHIEDDIPKIIVANKCDLPPSERIVSQEEGQALAEKYKVPFRETSAKDGTNVDEVFVTLA